MFETETITFSKYSLRSKFFYIADLIDKVSDVFPPEIISPQECPKDLLFKADPRNPHIFHWHVWLKPTSLKFPYFEGLCGDCLDINLGPIQDDGLGLFRLEDKWIMLSAGNADDDDDLIYGKEINGQDPPPNERPDLPTEAASPSGRYEFRYIISIEHTDRCS